jgi:sigma-B regulation protein RsbU (phosphoserine phosphatase)
MFCCIVDSKTGDIRYSNAGHPKPRIIGKNHTVELEENDPFLGPIKDMKYSTFKAKLNKDESLFIYTDGLLDIIDDEYHQVNLERFAGILTGKDVIDRETFNEFTTNISNEKLIRSDDCTVMVIRKK